jgi:hypothetical protein
MTKQTGNLSETERTLSALLGLSFSFLALRSRGATLRALNGVAGAALLARAVAGHCGVKAALGGHSSLGEGLADQWRRMRGVGTGPASGAPDAAQRTSTRDAVDTAANDSFAASDPPASRLPDVPP